jgi:formylglycine-generating enzyme required for sulfatase activity
MTPPGSVGAADVVVTGSKGTLNLTGGFSYRAVITPAWASLVAALPDPEVIPNESLRNAIAATGYAWHVRDSGTGIEMLLIPPGSFNMGCSSSGVYSCDMKEIPVHPVSLSSPFYMGRYEVTQAQWLAKMGTNPSYWQARPENGNTADTNRPVENVSWNMITGAGGFLLGTGLRLPTEAEWEYACRAGTTTAFHGFPGQLGGTNDDAHITNISWFDGNNGTSGTAAWGTKAVGQKLANGFGLHDMSGNVWEWVNDWDSNTYYAWSPLTDPPGPEAGLYRVLRGGSWGANTFYLRSSSRVGEWPSTSASNGNYGLRVVRNP